MITTVFIYEDVQHVQSKGTKSFETEEDHLKATKNNSTNTMNFISFKEKSTNIN